MPPSSRLATAALWVAGAALVGGLSVGLATLAMNWPPPPASWGFTGFQIPIAIAFGAMGFLVLRRQPANRIGWLLLLEGVLTAIQFGVDLPAQALVGKPDPSIVWIAWVSNWIWVVSVSLIPPLFLLFPDGRPIGPRWWLAGLSLIVGASLMAIGQATTPGPLLNYPTIENPVTIGGSWSQPVFGAGGLLLLGGAALSVASLLLRWRRSSGDAREQLKWLAFVGMPAVLAGAFAATVPIAQLLLIGFGGAVPVAIAIAILRHRLYDIDELISRAFIYGALTAILAGLYAAALKFFNELFVQLTGASSESSVILATLVLAAAFTPVRKALERLIDRRFKPSLRVAEVTAESPLVELRAADLETVVRRVVREELAADANRS